MIALKGLYPSRTGSSDIGRFVGEIRMFAGTFAPGGWAFCDGQELPVSKNKGLFAAIGTTYGGDETKFSLPDLRGRIPVHVGRGPGLDGVKQGATGGGKKVAQASDPEKTTSTRASLAIRYMISLEGVDPEKKAPDSFIGEVRILTGKSAPRGWGACDGQILSIAQHTALFSLLGTMYGGDGRTTFGLPGLRGRTPVHAGEGPEVEEVKQGQRRGGRRAALAADSDKAITTPPYLGVRYIIALHGIYPSRN
ncbi:MAG: tail fiber protein [Pirellulaceae bacterium]|nr:tail fiber protein [Pirellulaceae bacterium]MDP7019862.1 tail fiber protein [Pirellulaceae bacterium]